MTSSPTNVPTLFVMFMLFVVFLFLVWPTDKDQ